MSKEAFFVVFDLTTGDLKRHGKCPAEHVYAQARPHKNEGVRIDRPRTPDEAKELLVSERMVLPAKAAPYLRKRPAAEIEARRPRKLTSPTVVDLMRVLEQKHGIKITPEDLAAAKKP
jgi:hypothetical protein